MTELGLSEEKVRARSKGIGGSDVPILLELAKYKTPVQLWMEKTGRSEPLDISGNISVEMGNRLEQVVADMFSDRTRLAVRRSNITREHPVFPFMRGNIDRQVVGERAGLECKAWSYFASDQWGESGSSEVPIAVTAQCAHYMELYDFQRWFVAVLLGGNDFRWYVLERDEAVAERLLSAEATFWQCVIEDRPPAPLNGDDVARLYGKSEGETIATDDIVDAVEALANVKRQAASLEELKLRLEFQVKSFMGPAGDLIGPDGKPLVTWRTAKDSVAEDWHAVAKALAVIAEVSDSRFARIVERTMQRTPGSRRFNVKGWKA